jgi:hypothetical protein
LTTTATRTISKRSAAAPTGPGVYVFLGDDNALLYIGKARNLRRRLADHARTPTGRQADVREVRWIECRDEAEALCLEADLVVALSPPFNATMAADTYEYVCLERTSESRVRFVLTDRPSRKRLVYGGFPHLGKGKGSWPGVRSKAGYSGLLRLLWVAHAGDENVPSRLHGDSPPTDHEARFDYADLPALRDFLSGRSPALLRRLSNRLAAPEFMRRQLERDAEAAEQFYWLGPCRMRELRARHGLRGPVDEDSFRRAVTQDLQSAIGAFVARTQAFGTELAGRRMARSIARRARFS